MEFDYFYGPEDAEQYQFYRIPKLLITSERFKDVSVESKLLYGLMLDRLSLSIKNGWFDALNRAYIIYTVEDVMEDTPWASFVLPAKAVHENQYGKGMQAKIPADGHTTLTKPYLAGQSEDGKNIWKDEKTTVSNRELKSMVEFYKRDLVPKYDIPEL